MYESALRIAQSPGGEARIMFENAAQGQQLSWNDDVDYAEFLRNANPAVKKAVEELYKKAGLSLEGDIKRINDAPRLKASSHALKFWNAPGRNVIGRPKIPVLRLHMVGDYQIPYTLVHGYMAAVSANGKDDLVRTAFVRSTGHCNYTAAESAATIEVLMQRLKTGTWPDTRPEKLNALADSLETNTKARFMPIEGYGVAKFNRAWIPE
jgi:hypothetical protein